MDVNVTAMCVPEFPFLCVNERWETDAGNRKLTLNLCDSAEFSTNYHRLNNLRYRMSFKSSECFSCCLDLIK